LKIKEIDMRPIEEQVILVTGATDGIGKITALELARMGAKVLVHGRSREKCTAVVKAIHDSKNGRRKPGSYVGDFSSLASVRDLARKITADIPRLDVLINNAGVGPGIANKHNRPLSQDGHELMFAVNYLAPYMLTHLLIPLLEHAAPSRLVNVCSAAQEPIDFDDVMCERDYDPMRAYARSKLALTMFTFDLAEGLKDRKITANCLHPGSLLDTKMVKKFAAPRGSAESGAQVEIYVATDPDLNGRTGMYFDEKRQARAHEQAYDSGAREKLDRIAKSLTEIGKPVC
jgi:NAD(P)-dependent dehydrogenase (short-subunit alcohol dehydrogenase family)